MKIDRVVVGRLECNCYLLDINNSVLVIDPGDEFNKIKDKIGNKKVVGIIITHHHFDHDGVVDKMLLEYNVNVYDKNNMCEGENVIDKFKFEVIYTPGHREDAITIYFKEDGCMFCGDFIFRDSIGRCDLPGGNVDDMINSINKIMKYDRDIILYCGHGENTTIGYEVSNNIYFNDVNML